MSTEEKIMFMFTALHGEYSGSYSAGIIYDDSYEPLGVQITNEEGYSCGFYSKLGILFDYLTREM